MWLPPPDRLPHLMPAELRRRGGELLMVRALEIVGVCSRGHSSIMVSRGARPRVRPRFKVRVRVRVKVSPRVRVKVMVKFRPMRVKVRPRVRFRVKVGVKVRVRPRFRVGPTLILNSSPF